MGNYTYCGFWLSATPGNSYQIYSYWRPLDSRTRFNSKLFRVFSKSQHPGKLHCGFFSPEKLARSSLLKEGKPSPERKLMKTGLHNYDIFVKTCSRMTTAVMFSRQNDADSGVRKTQYRENLVLVVILVLESKGFYCKQQQQQQQQQQRKTLSGLLKHLTCIRSFLSSSMYLCVCSCPCFCSVFIGTLIFTLSFLLHSK